jgi:FemAB-related protein (PEP-CTERM system-associated)
VIEARVETSPPADWDSFVAAHPRAQIYHEARWALLPTRLFGYRSYFLSTRDAQGALSGVLPLVHQRGGLGGFLVSLPYFNYCGTLAGDESARAALTQRAFRLGDELRVKYVQLREEQAPAGAAIASTDKVAMRMELPGSAEELGRRLGSKLRSQARRADREGANTRIGGRELLGDFFSVFCSVMRDLGTPVYPRRFFDAVFEAAGDRASLVIVDLAGVPSGAGFLLSYRDGVEIPWAGTITAAKPKSVNMKLYWDVLMHCIARGHRRFDFGRSSNDSGTFKFKQQWGAAPTQLYWQEHGVAAPRGGRGRVAELATRAWQRLPLKCANLLGPVISPGLPW